MFCGARTPEELETLFEDAVMLDDREALQQIFEADAILVTAPGAELRGRDEIAHARLADVVAGPLRVLQAGRTALVLGPRTISAVRRSADGSWRYSISLRYP